MARVRKRFEGVTNIIRFNWHLYLLPLKLVIILFLAASFSGSSYTAWAFLLSVLIIAPVIISLAVSFYIYDLSTLYRLDWLSMASPGATILNINAGFDETSHLLQLKYPASALIVYDFYNPAKHTEISIRRARRAYPPFPGTQPINTRSLPLQHNSVDTICLIFAAHEIREDEERTAFFKELHRVLAPGGKIIVTEHLRDLPNFLAYTIGFFHFLSKNTWLTTFGKASLAISHTIKTTPFITTFILEKNGTAP
jgi:SAM-dependent methyltransferase